MDSLFSTKVEIVFTYFTSNVSEFHLLVSLCPSRWSEFDKAHLYSSSAF